MSGAPADGAAEALARQTKALRTVLAAEEGLLTRSQVLAGGALLEKAERRIHLSPEHTTVGFFGATGSGKSSLFNRVVGFELARPGVTRPTTFEVTAAVWQTRGASDLLEWLRVDKSAEAGDSPPLILLDLPDFDSVAEENRAVVDRLVGQVDVLVWVVDPQKYGDRVIHQDYIEPLSHHASTTLVVLNQVDLLEVDERRQIAESLGNMLSADGLRYAQIFETSAATGEGVEALKDAIGSISQERRASTLRLSADLGSWGQEVLRSVGDGRTSVETRADTRGAARELNQAVQLLAGVEMVGDAVASSYKKRAAQATGLPLVSWIHRLRTDPLRRLGVERATETGARASLPPLSSASKARLNTAVRSYAHKIGAAVPEGWRHEVDTTSKRAAERLQQNLDLAVLGVDYRMERAWWWPVASILQGIFLVAALVGAGWYLAAWVTAALALPAVQIPKIEGWPVPGLLILAGLLAGFLLSMLFGGFASIGASRRRRLATASLRSAVDEVTDKEVARPLADLLRRVQELEQALLMVRN